jgi:hypothetical protein
VSSRWTITWRVSFAQKGSSRKRPILRQERWPQPNLTALFSGRGGPPCLRGLRSERKLGLRAVLTGLVLLTVTLTAILIHATWFYTACQNVPDVVGQLNHQIVGSVQDEVRGTLNDAWSVKETVRSIFVQETIKDRRGQTRIYLSRTVVVASDALMDRARVSRRSLLWRAESCR